MKLRVPGGSLAVGLLLLAIVLVLGNVIAARQYLRLDLTSSRLFSLSDGTRQALASLGQSVKLTVFMAPPRRYTESVYHEVVELLRRFERVTPRVSVEMVDVDADRARAELLARQLKVNAGDLQEGLVVVQHGSRTKYLRASELVQVEQGRAAAFFGEPVLVGAIRSVTGGEAASICFSSGHGEAPMDTYDDAGYGRIADEVRRESHEVSSVDPRQLGDGRLGDCSVLVIGGPTRAFVPAELAALDRYLSEGGRLLAMVGPVLDRGATRYKEIAIDRWLRRWGVELPPNIVVDVLALPGERRMLTWGTRTGYTKHPIVRPLAGKLTIWRLAREVRPVAKDQLKPSVLVQTSKQGWGEADLRSLRGEEALRFDPLTDSRGPVPVGVAVRWRGKPCLVVLGSERGLLNRRLDGSDYSRSLFLGALAWLVGGDSQVDPSSAKRLENVRLKLDERQLSRVFLIVVVGLPAIALCLALVVWRRRST